MIELLPFLAHISTSTAMIRVRTLMLITKDVGSSVEERDGG